MIRLHPLPALVLIAAALGCRPAPPSGGPGPVRVGAGIDSLTIREVSRVLAHDDLQGRGTGSEGARLAARYLAAECQRLGLLPGFGESYLQPVPLARATVVGERTTIRVRGPGVDTTFVHHEDFIPDVATGATLRGFAGPLAYVGRAQDILFRRSDLPPLEGTVALLRGEFGAFGEAADTLKARGAIGVIEVVDDARRYRLFRQTRGASRFFHADPAAPSSFIPPLPSMLAGPRMTVTLYQGLTGVSHGSWNDAYLNGLAAGLPSPRLLEGWSAEVRVEAERRPASSDNVACLLPGSGGADAGMLVLSAHYDHLGVGVPDARGDSVYNGFSDNAVGVAMAMAVAEAFQRDRQARGASGALRHGLLLLFPTGEEQGLLGSDHFVARPPVPLERIVAVVNLDANAPLGPPTSWRVAAEDTSRLGQLVVAEATRRGWEAALAPPAPGSDYYPFLRRGVPAVFFVPSTGPYEGLSITASDSLRALAWARYHQAADEWQPDFPFLGLTRYAEFTRDVLAAVDRGAGAQRVAGPSTPRTEPGGSR